MNILFIHEVDWLKKVVIEYHNLSGALALLGHKIYAIDYEDRWSRDGFFSLGSLKTRELEIASRAVDGTSVSLRRPGFIKMPGLSRMSAWVTHFLEIRRTIREKAIDVILLYSVPTNGLQTISLARKFNIPVVFRSIDILYQLVPYAVLRPPTRFLERKVYTKADIVLAITPNHARYVLGMGAEESRVKVLPMPIDTDMFRSGVDCSEVGQKWGLSQQDKVIVFIGYLFDFSGLDGFIKEFPKVLSQVPEAKLLIVGDGPQRPTLERIIGEHGLDDKVIITGIQPYQTMPQYINLATVCINPFLYTPDTKDIFPGKIIQYVACGRATVATPLEGIKSLISGESQGVIYAESASEMTSEVVGLLEEPERREKIAGGGVEYVKKAHDQGEVAHQLEMELMGIIGSKRVNPSEARQR
jgi:glycosyltransferase involved in cell wall biosynthesis